MTYSYMTLKLKIWNFIFKKGNRLLTFFLNMSQPRQQTSWPEYISNMVSFYFQHLDYYIPTLDLSWVIVETKQVLFSKKLKVSLYFFTFFCIAALFFLNWSFIDNMLPIFRQMATLPLSFNDKGKKETPVRNLVHFKESQLKNNINSCTEILLTTKLPISVNAQLQVKKQKSYMIRSCNNFHIILRLFDILPNFPFTTSETKRNYQ